MGCGRPLVPVLDLVLFAAREVGVELVYRADEGLARRSPRLGQLFRGEPGEGFVVLRAGREEDEGHEEGGEVLVLLEAGLQGEEGREEAGYPLFPGSVLAEPVDVPFRRCGDGSSPSASSSSMATKRASRPERRSSFPDSLRQLRSRGIVEEGEEEDVLGRLPDRGRGAGEGGQEALHVVEGPAVAAQAAQPCIHLLDVG